ncbi:MAG: YqgE/AlgH family protein [Flavobacteriales bacterium]|nr:MAG: YqgE/AlgH family protein [Flavobacteriales bacterium]
MISLKPDKGFLLVAEPSIIGDLSFNRSVVFLAEYNENGSVGFILNKPLPYTIRDFIPEINSTIPVYNGGPVEQDNLYFIHKIPELIPNSIEISNGIYWGGDFNEITSLLQENQVKESEIRFFLGYSGWSNQQLEQELEVNSWVVSSNNYKNRLLGETDANFWKEKMIEFGGDYLIWSNAPENPSYN